MPNWPGGGGGEGVWGQHSSTLLHGIKIYHVNDSLPPPTPRLGDPLDKPLDSMCSRKMSCSAIGKYKGIGCYFYLFTSTLAVVKMNRISVSLLFCTILISGKVKISCSFLESVCREVWIPIFNLDWCNSKRIGKLVLRVNIVNHPVTWPIQGVSYLRKYCWYNMQSHKLLKKVSSSNWLIY